MSSANPYGNVSEEEFREALSSLSGVHDFSHEQINKLRMVVSGYKDHHPATGLKGIDAKEVDEIVTWFEKNKSLHNLPDAKVKAIGDQLRKRL